MSEDELGFWEAPGSFAHWQDMRESWLENLRETQVPELGNNNSIQGLSGDTSDSEMTDSSRTEASNVSRESPVYPFLLLGIVGFYLAVIAISILIVAVFFPTTWGLFVRCIFAECCYGTNWIQLNASGLQEDLNAHVIGQHIAVDLVTNVLKDHTNQNREPKKALVMSFEGTTGSGKNYVSSFIAKHFFERGMGSQFVHKIIVTHHYPLGGVAMLDKYKADLRDKIMTAGKIIFDEMDKMPPGLIDVLYPFLDHHEDVEGVDFRRSMFLFLSNSRASQINEFMLKQHRTGIKRESIAIKNELDEMLSSFDEEGGALWHARLIKDRLIDYFVPFLPLERYHVRDCASAEMFQSNLPVTEKVLDSVVNDHIYWPKDEQLYSVSGCKKVCSKIDFHSFDS